MIQSIFVLLRIAATRHIVDIFVSTSPLTRLALILGRNWSGFVFDTLLAKLWLHAKNGQS